MYMERETLRQRLAGIPHVLVQPSGRAFAVLVLCAEVLDAAADRIFTGAVRPRCQLTDESDAS